MAFKNANAYQGAATMPNGVTVRVDYYNAKAIRSVFGYEPPGHPARKRVGWYWWQVRGEPIPEPRPLPFGPFTSSRLAMQDAIAKNPAT